MRDDGMIAGIEVKASATVKAGDFGGLRTLGRDVRRPLCLWCRPLRQHGVVPFGDRLAAAPLSSLWNGTLRTNKADKSR
jgi:uncharacterized protein